MPANVHYGSCFIAENWVNCVCTIVRCYEFGQLIYGLSGVANLIRNQSMIYFKFQLFSSITLPVTIRRHHVSLIKQIFIIICIIFGLFLLYRSFDMVKNIQKVEERFSAKVRDLNNVGNRLNIHLDKIDGGHLQHTYYRNFEKIRKDWHDYEYIEKERQRVGLGENGTAVDDSQFGINNLLLINMLRFLKSS